jgi:hypothetical protein
MKVNRAKSGIMHFDWSKRTTEREDTMFGYPVVREYKYLGGWVDEKLKV